MTAIRFSWRIASLAAAVLSFFTALAQGQTYQVLQSFRTEGQHPKTALVETAGAFFGTTSQGGAFGKGTISRVASDGTLTTLHEFNGSDGANPYATLLVGVDGNLYGTTSNGSTIFRIGPDGTGFTTLHAFQSNEGSNPRGALIQGSDGNLYGTTHDGGAHNSGTIFVFDSTTMDLTTLHDFDVNDGGFPVAGLLQAADGDLYGAASAGGGNGLGTLFKIDTLGTTFTKLHDFDGTDGSAPFGTLLQAPDGKLYGTTVGGGTNFEGTVFQIDTAGVLLVTLHSFVSVDGQTPQAGLILGTDGELYGTAYAGGSSSHGTVFRIGTDGMGFEAVHSFSGQEGAFPYGALLEASDGKLYGTTDDTGNLPSQYGTVFRLEPDGSIFETLYTFGPFHLGNEPHAEPIPSALVPGTLYGGTSQGGAHNFGVIYRVGTDGSAYQVLHDFTFTDGARPYARLTEGPDGMLYGTTFSGGDGNGRGTVFQLDPSGPTLTTLHVFTGNGDDGANPGSGVILGTDGLLYGTTESGGASANFGTVYRIGTDGNGYQTIHSFDGTDGQIPRGTILQAADGRLYGTTVYWGPNNVGTIYRLETGGANFVTLHAFDTTDGANSYAGLIQAPDGYLYGTTYVGGANGVGTVFQIDTEGALLKTIHTFSTSDGAGPEAALILAQDGHFYGTTNVGGTPSTCASGCGSVFRLDADGSAFATVHIFDPAGGAGPMGGVLQGADGLLYGATAFGGDADGGVVFRLALCQMASPPPMTVDLCLPASAPGLVASVPGKAGASYAWTIAGGTIDSGQGSSTISFTSGAAGAAMNLSVSEIDGSGCLGSSATALQVDFLDVAPADPFHPYVCTIGRDGITAGCGGGVYCRNDPVTRAQMAVFLLKAKHGASYVPPSCAGVFSDVACPGLFADWIEELSAEGITAGCGGGNYCPEDAVTRAQMSVFLLKAEHGSSYVPPACGGAFGDVTCPSLFADWIEQLAAEGITAGCGGGNYCPSLPNTRGQMAVFLVRTFQLM